MMQYLAQSQKTPWTYFISYNALCLCVGFVFICAVSLSIAHVQKIDGPATPNASAVSYNIENTSIGSVSFFISGWAFMKGKDIAYHANTVVLGNAVASYVLPTKFIPRQTTEHPSVADEKGFARSGFFAHALRLSIPNGTYKIYIRHKTSEIDQIVDTGQTISFDSDLNIS